MNSRSRIDFKEISERLQTLKALLFTLQIHDRSDRHGGFDRQRALTHPCMYGAFISFLNVCKSSMMEDAKKAESVFGFYY